MDFQNSAISNSNDRMTIIYHSSIIPKMTTPAHTRDLFAMSTNALHLTLNISETVRDKGLVPKDHQYEIACGLSNGHVTDDVT